MKPKKTKTYLEEINLDEDVLLELLKLIDRSTLFKILNAKYSDYSEIDVDYRFDPCCGSEECYCDFPSVVVKLKREMK